MQKKVKFIGNMIHILNQTFSQECDKKLDNVI